jgi:hypothetical protein
VRSALWGGRHVAGLCSSVGIETGYGLHDYVSNAGGGEIFHTCPGTNPTSCTVGTGSLSRDTVACIADIKNGMNDILVLWSVLRLKSGSASHQTGGQLPWSWFRYRVGGLRAVHRHQTGHCVARGSWRLRSTRLRDVTVKLSVGRGNSTCQWVSHVFCVLLLHRCCVHCLSEVINGTKSGIARD